MGQFSAEKPVAPGSVLSGNQQLSVEGTIGHTENPSQTTLGNARKCWRSRLALSLYRNQLILVYHIAMVVAAREEPSQCPASPTPRFVSPSILASRQAIRPRRTKS